MLGEASLCGNNSNRADPHTERSDTLQFLSPGLYWENVLKWNEIALVLWRDVLIGSGERRVCDMKWCWFLGWRQESCCEFMIYKFVALRCRTRMLSRICPFHETANQKQILIGLFLFKSCKKKCSGGKIYKILSNFRKNVQTDMHFIIFNQETTSQKLIPASLHQNFLPCFASPKI